MRNASWPGRGTACTRRFSAAIGPAKSEKNPLDEKNGVIFSLFWFIFFTMFMTSFFGILGAPGEIAGLMAVIGVFGTMMIILASLLFLPSSKPLAILQQHQTPPPPSLYGAAQQPALPPQQSIPASAYTTPRPGTWRDTNDLEPASVTEGTTKLLNEDDR